MFKSVHHLYGYTVMAGNDNIGHIDDIYFDDHNWIVQYFVIDTGNLFEGQKVLLSPTLIKHVDDEVEVLSVTLDRNGLSEFAIATDQIVLGEAPATLSATEAGPPVSQLGGGLFDEETVGMSDDSIIETIRAKEGKEETPPAESSGTRSKKGHRNPIYSSKELIGSYIHATDGDIGHIEDLVVDEKLWAIQKVIIDTRNWLPGKKVQIEPKWIDSIDWTETAVYLSLSKSAVKNQPRFDPANPVAYPAKTL
ncbi:MAG: PRC-barrel domain-containing protein [Anaerolineae bacterium]|nr:PRC-barrel domain-containing protein [Anaerolineae bacterium]